VTPAPAADPIQLIVNHQLYASSESALPQLVEDRVYVPLRLVSEQLGYQVQWNEASRQVTILTDQESEIALREPVAEDTQVAVAVDHQFLQLDDDTGLPFVTESGYTMIPLRAVGEALNCEVEWQDGVVIVNARPPAVEGPVTEESNPSEKSNPSEEINAENHYAALTIQGDSIASIAQLNAYLTKKEPDIRAMMERNYPELGFTPFPEDIAALYVTIGQKYGIRGDLAFAQALKETGYFQFYGSVRSFQNNFCGLGAAGTENTGQEVLNGVDPMRVYSIAGLHGLSYLTVADGVEAHIQHLYAYATDADLPADCELLDPRFSYVKRGTASRWVDLDGRWAIPGNGYGESIIQDYWMPAMDSLQ